MNSIALQRSKGLGQRIAAAFVLLCTLAIVPATNAQIFYSNVPDFYQHQKYGPGNNQIEDPDWEAGANNFGWCFYVSTVNQFFFFKKKGYNGLLNDDVTAPPPKWLPAVNDASKTIIKDLASDSALQKACRDTGNPLLQAPINCILKDRGAGPQLGINGGLIHQFFEQSGADVSFKSSDGTARTIPNTTLFAEMQKYLNAGDSVNLRVGHAKSNKLWWSGDDPLTTGHFHSVTVAGVDTTAGRERIWFADPDSNPDHNHASKVLVEVAWLPGNANNNAGWYSTPDEANCGADGGKHTNLQCIRLRRFVGNELVPVPVSKPPTQKESDQRYFEAVMKAGLTSFNGKGAGFDRYDDTDIVGLNMIQVVKGAAKGGGASPGSAATFEVTPGDYGATPIDEFWLFAASPDQITSVQLPVGWTAEIISGPGKDPWDNDRNYGWVHAYTLIDPLFDKDVLDMTYDTQSHNPLAAWDVMFGYQSSPANLRIQVFGANPSQEYNQLGPNN